jgi:hypothetical protein
MKQPKKQTKKKKSSEPELLEHSYLDDGKGKRLPYIFFALIVFVILSFIWKGFMRTEMQDGAQSVPEISPSEVARPSDLVK